MYVCSVDIYLLYMIKLRVSSAHVVCGECYYLAVIDRSIAVLSPPLSPFYFVF